MTLFRLDRICNEAVSKISIKHDNLMGRVKEMSEKVEHVDKVDLNNWNCNNSCLQALALSPRSETVESRGGRSPMISPGASPQLLRRGTAPPPPLPPRRASPILGSPANSASQLTVPKEDAPPPPRNAHTSAEHTTNVQQEISTVHNGPVDSRYDVLQPSNKIPALHQSCPSAVNNSPPQTADPLSKSATTAHFTSETIAPTPPPPPPPPPSDNHPTLERQLSGPHVIHYAELANISEEPSYENTVLLPGNVTAMKPVYSSTPGMEVPTVSPVVHQVKPPPTETRVSIELSANVCVRPTPSRGSSVDSQCSSTSSHSHGLVASQALTETQPVPAYENLNMDHIARLTSEGYTQDAVIRALGITRNDLDMAWDILNEFATKQT